MSETEQVDLGPTITSFAPRKRVVVQRILGCIAVGGIALFLAACGASKAPSVASVATTTTSAATSAGAATKPSPAALASCMTSHGFAASPGSAATAPENSVHLSGVTLAGNVDPNSPQLQAAMRACRKFFPGGGPPPLTPAQKAENAKAMGRFASCMRKNGVANFPDPNGQGTLPHDALTKLDPSNPGFQNAYKACVSLEPKGISFG